MSEARATFTAQQVREIHDQPLTELIHRAQGAHREHHQADAVQLCSLLSIKTGGCPEDCAYCPQSARHGTRTEPEKLMPVEQVLERLQEGFDPLVRDLGRRSGQRDNRWTHVVAAEGASEVTAELAVERPAAPPAPGSAAPAPPPAPSGPTALERLDKLEAAVAELKEELRGLRVRLGDLEE